MWILEAQEFIPCQGFRHVGYVSRVFKKKKDACDYYDIHNPDMRSLNAHNTWVSDWHPETKLRYVVRKYNYEIQTLTIF